jgi:hypothetical protein
MEAPTVPEQPLDDGHVFTSYREIVSTMFPTAEDDDLPAELDCSWDPTDSESKTDLDMDARERVGAFAR